MPLAAVKSKVATGFGEKSSQYVPLKTSGKPIPNRFERTTVTPAGEVKEISRSAGKSCWMKVWTLTAAGLVRVGIPWTSMEELVGGSRKLMGSPEAKETEQGNEVQVVAESLLAMRPTWSPAPLGKPTGTTAARGENPETNNNNNNKTGKKKKKGKPKGCC
jgi:hypothetical protein